jgi:lipid-binding SYLF domain-containing protein
MDKRQFLSLAASASLLGLATACTTTGPGSGANPADRRRSIDAAVDEAIVRLHGQVPESRELMAKARGVLVFPSVLSAGFVVGGSYGQGALRKGGRSAAYYSTAAGSVGLLAGAQSKSVFVLFMTQDSLDKFEASQGWTAGADASITVVNIGADAKIDTRTIQQPIIGFVLAGVGLMANLSLDGTKFTRLDL